MSKWITLYPLGKPDQEIDDYVKLPSIPACYVIYCDDVPVYVGQTTNLYKRILSYCFRYAYTNSIITPWQLCRGLKVKYRPGKKYGDWAMIELRLIKRLQPIHNCVGSTKKRRTNA